MDPSLEFGSGSTILPQAMKEIRNRRLLTTAVVAERMGMKPRTYEDFEAGRGPMSLPRIFLFAEATDSDPFGLMLGEIFQSTELAVETADTKFPMIMIMSFMDFIEKVGGDIAYLDPVLLIEAFRKIFEDIETRGLDRDKFIRRWIEGRKGRISMQDMIARLMKRRKPDD